MTEIEKLIAEWMEWLFIVRGRQAYGVSQYSALVRRFFAWMDTRGVEWELQTIAREDIEEWMRVLFYDFGNISNQSRASKLSALRNFFTWANVKGHRAGNPTTGIPSPKIKQKHPQIYSTEQLRALFAAPDRTKITGVRDYTIIRLLHAAGPRASELCNLDISSVYDSGKYIRIHFGETKGGSDRTIILKDRASKFMRDWLVIRSGILTDSPALFITIKGGQHNRVSPKIIDNIMKHHSGRVLGDSIHTFAHKMRSTFATDLFNETGDIVTVQLAMGHKKIETTMRYIAISKRHLDRLALPNSRFKEIEEG